MSQIMSITSRFLRIGLTYVAVCSRLGAEQLAQALKNLGKIYLIICTVLYATPGFACSDYWTVDYYTQSGCDVMEMTHWGWNDEEDDYELLDIIWWYDCPEIQNDPDCGGDSCDWCPNHFRITDGNASRSIEDLAVKGAVTKKFGLMRHHNTVYREGKQYFGLGGNWRHNWQFDLIPRKTVGSDIPTYELIYPDGTRRHFEPAAAGTWKLDFLNTEKFRKIANGFEIEDQDGRVLYFSQKLINGRAGFQMERWTDAYGLATDLKYDSEGYLIEVIEPGGRRLNFKYDDYRFLRGTWTAIGALNAPNLGEATRLELGNMDEKTQFLRIRAPQGSKSIDVAELEVLGRSGEPIKAKFFGVDEVRPNLPTASVSFADGDPATKMSGLRVCGIELGKGQTPTAIKVLSSRGYEGLLQGVVVDTLVTGAASERLLTSVVSDNGSTVRYEYNKAIDPISKCEIPVLNRVLYDDKTEAKYRYGWVANDPRPILRPMMIEADDPRYTGRAKKIQYSYNDQLGTIHEEINPTTGIPYATLEIDKNDKDKRAVLYSDLRTVTYLTKENALGARRLTERTDSLGRKTTIQYSSDGLGQVASITDHSGRVATYDYHATGKVSAIYVDGRPTRQIERDSAGRPLKSIDASGQETLYERDYRGRLVKVTKPDGSTTELTHDSLGRVTKYKDNQGNSHEFSYTPHNRIAEYRKPNGGIVKFGYDEKDNLTVITDSIGRVTKRQTNDRGQLTKITYHDGRTRQFAYDTYGRKTSEVNERGIKQSWKYDDIGRVTAQENDDKQTLFDYAQFPQGCGSCSMALNASEVVQHDGRVSKMLYDSEGRLIMRTTDAGTAEAASTTYSYDSYDNIVSVTDPIGRVTRYEYDSERNVTKVVEPGERITKIEYDKHGWIKQITRPGEIITKFIYDSKGVLLAEIDPNGTEIKYPVYENSSVTRFVDQYGKVSTSRYAYGKIAEKEYGDGSKAMWTYDLVGRAKKITSPSDVVTNFEYDNGNRIVSVTSSQGRSEKYTYDSFGNRLTAQDSAGRLYRWEYDTRGNPVVTVSADGTMESTKYDSEGRKTSSTNAAGHSTRYEYDQRNTQIRQVDAKGSVYNLTFDSLRRPLTTTFPDGTTEARSYDLVGQLIKLKVRDGAEKRFKYNLAGQLTEESWNPVSAGAAVQYYYDDAGRLSKAVSGGVTLTYVYDRAGRKISESTNIEGNERTVSYQYDQGGRLSAVTHPSGKVRKLNYDSKGRIDSVEWSGEGVVGSYSYGKNHELVRLQLKNGVTADYGYTNALELNKISYSGGGTIPSSVTYDRDAAGRIVRRSIGGTVQSYRYDNLGQLIGATYGAGGLDREEYEYDAEGNRTKTVKISAGGSEEVLYKVNSNNQYTELNVTRGAEKALRSLKYDPNGNLTSDGVKSFTYDSENKLLSVEYYSNGVFYKTQYVYDAFKRCVQRSELKSSDGRVWIKDKAAVRNMVYDSQWNAISEYDGNGALKYDYVSPAGDDANIACDTAEGLLYLSHDGLGDIVRATSSSGDVVEDMLYTGFGAALSGSGSSKVTLNEAVRMMRSGREILPSVGIASHRYRYYHQELGRWMSPDPIGLVAGNNVYSYLSNGPIGKVDPFGLSEVLYHVNASMAVVNDTTVYNWIAASILRMREHISWCCSNACLACGVEINHQMHSSNTNYYTPLSYYEFTNGVGYYMGSTGYGSGPKSAIVTNLPIYENGSPANPTIEAFGSPNGVIVRYTSGNASKLNTFSHEAGHAAGYNGGNVDGNSHWGTGNATKLMYWQYTTSQQYPDSNWCTKIAALAQ